MWLMVQFDLPVDSKPRRRSYVRFRKSLRRQGFERFQKSIYARWEDSDATAETRAAHLAAEIPAEGDVSLFRFSDRTMNSSSFFSNGTQIPSPQPPSSFLLC